MQGVRRARAEEEKRKKLEAAERKRQQVESVFFTLIVSFSAFIWKINF
jgi:hypothetical protein